MIFGRLLKSIIIFIKFMKIIKAWGIRIIKFFQSTPLAWFYSLRNHRTVLSLIKAFQSKVVLLWDWWIQINNFLKSTVERLWFWNRVVSFVKLNFRNWRLSSFWKSVSYWDVFIVFVCEAIRVKLDRTESRDWSSLVFFYFCDQ